MTYFRNSEFRTIKRYFLHIICCILLLTVCKTVSIAQSQGSARWYEMPVVSGKCFARCLIQDSFAIHNEVYLEYKGSDPHQPGVSRKEITIVPSTSRWIKREGIVGIDISCCMGGDPCLVWVLEETPAQIDSFYMVTDTSSIKSYKRRLVSIPRLARPGGYNEWRETLCADAPQTQEIYRKLSRQLNKRGYQVIADSNNVTLQQLIPALIQFQKENLLPVGQLDMQTLAALGVL